MVLQQYQYFFACFVNFLCNIFFVFPYTKKTFVFGEEFFTLLNIFLKELSKFTLFGMSLVPIWTSKESGLLFTKSSTLFRTSCCSRIIVNFYVVSFWQSYFMNTIKHRIASYNNFYPLLFVIIICCICICCNCWICWIFTVLNISLETSPVVDALLGLILTFSCRTKSIFRFFQQVVFLILTLYFLKTQQLRDFGFLVCWYIIVHRQISDKTLNFLKYSLLTDFMNIFAVFIFLKNMLWR